MRLLLDSHVLLWWLGFPKEMSQAAYKAVNDIENQIFVSSASLWELRIKESKGQLTMPRNLTSVLNSERVFELPVKWEHSEHLYELPPIHKDPFDRMLVAQAIQESLTFVTSDKTLFQYPVSILKA